MATQHPKHQFKGLQDWIEVFRAGTHTDSKGRECTFTTADLDQMVANLATLGAAPLVLGHPKHDDPAYGWAKQGKREGDSLYIKASDVNPAFEAGVDSGAYRNRSLSIAKTKDHGWRVQHVGWLGAALPALDGLQPLNYTAEPDSHEFVAEYDISYALDDIASMLRAWRESVIADKGIEAADALIPDWRISSIAASAVRIRDAASSASNPPPLFTQPNPGAAMPFTQEDLNRTAAETEARVRAEQTAQFSAQTAELARLNAERQTERIATQITSWKAAGQLLPAEEAGLAEFMVALEGGTAAEFQFTAAGAPAPTKQTPAQFFAAFVAARGKLVKLAGPGAGADTDPSPQLDLGDANAIADAAKQFQAAEAVKGKTISIDQAVAYVTRKPG